MLKIQKKLKCTITDNVTPPLPIKLNPGFATVEGLNVLLYTKCEDIGPCCPHQSKQSHICFQGI